MTRFPLLIPVLGLVIGIITGDLFSVTFTYGVGLILVAILIYSTIISKSIIPSLSYRLNRHNILWIFTFFVGSGIIASDLSIPHIPSSSEKYHLIGKVVEKKSLTSGDRSTIDIIRLSLISESYPIDSEDVNIANIHHLLLYSPPGEYRRGDIIETRGILAPIQDSPDQLSQGYAENMRHRGISSTFRVDDENLIKVTGQKHTFLDIAEEYRDRIDIFISHSSLATKTKIFLKAMLIGEREEMSEATRMVFADAGVAHILALSGMHVGILVMIVVLLSFPLSLAGLNKGRYLFIICVIWIYAFITGLSPTIVRAAVMASCVMGGYILERKQSGLNSLCLAILILAILEPGCIFNLGLQLSVVCVTSILVFTESLNPVNHRARPFLYKMVSIILITLVTTFATWPLTAFYFSRFPIMFIPANMIAVPLLPLYIALAIIYLVLLKLGLNSEILAEALDSGFNTLEWIATRLGGESSTLDLHIGYETLLLWGLGLIVAGAALHNKRTNKKIWGWCSMFILSIAVLSSPFFSPPQPNGFIIGRTGEKILLTTYTKGNKTEAIAKRGDLTLWNIFGKRIVVIDAALPHFTISKNWIKPDIIIIASNFNGTLDELVDLFSPEKILIHPSIYNKRENHLLENYKREVPVHRLRTQGAYQEISFRK